MENTTTIAFIGSGVMAEAMILGLLHNNHVKPECITAADPLAARGEYLTEHYGIRWTGDNRVAVHERDVVALSVKPQVMPHVLRELNGHIPPPALVLSIAAGVNVEMIVDGLSHQAVVRAMPNTPGQIGQGITLWTATPQVTETQLGLIRIILGAMGQEIFSANEDDLDKATALSGTGPAYVFLFMEAMIDAGVHLGFSRQVARQLVLQTMRGSVEYADQSGRHPAELRNQVTSPGGTSAEALYHMEKGGLRTVVSRSIWAAYQRSKALGSGRRRSEPPDSTV